MASEKVARVIINDYLRTFYPGLTEQNLDSMVDFYYDSIKGNGMGSYLRAYQRSVLGRRRFRAIGPETLEQKL